MTEKRIIALKTTAGRDFKKETGRKDRQVKGHKETELRKKRRKNKKMRRKTLTEKGGRK